MSAGSWWVSGTSNQPDIQIKNVPERQYGAEEGNADDQQSSVLRGILQIPHAMKSSRTNIPRFLHLTSIGT